ncbi:MAG: TIGR01777 family oxidoreductase [Flavisolibacter sp.]
METVLIAGGTGMIGSALIEELTKKDYSVIVLTRDARRHQNTERILYAEWNIKKGVIDAKAIEKADYIINLAGANVAEKRWSTKRKKEIVGSRVQTGKLLVKALQEIPNKVKAVISASAIGWYGPDAKAPNAKPFVETDAPAKDFLSATCQQWESAIQPVTQSGKRLVILRTGIVLSNDGGAFVEFKKPLKFGIAPILGNGKQVVSWIHMDDLVRLYMYATENENIIGVYNAVAPKPVTNKILVMEMAKQRNKFYLPASVPSFFLKTVLGEMSIEVLKSATVSSKKVEAAGFQFLFPGIETAIHNLVKRKK